MENGSKGGIKLEKIVGECLPVKSIADTLGSIMKIEGYIVMTNTSIATFKGKVEGAKIQIPDHIREAFSDGDLVTVIAYMTRPTPPAPPTPPIDKYTSSTSEPPSFTARTM